MSSILRGSRKIALGSFAGFGISLILTPVITRVYDPSTFGAFGLIVAVASTFIGFSTSRLEVLALRQSDYAQFSGLAWRGLQFSLILGASLTTLGIVFTLAGGNYIWALIGVLVVVGSLQLSGTAAHSRRGEYREIALGNFTQQGGMPAIQVCLGFTGSLWGLIAGFVLPRLVWLRASLRLRGGDRSVSTPWGEARPAAISALLNSAGSQLPVLLIALSYGITGSGFVALAQRIFTAPLQVVSSAISAASTAEVSALLRNDDLEAARTLVWRTMRTLALSAAGPLALAAVLAPMLAGRVLGAEWREIGYIVTALALGSYAQFCTAPFAQILNLTGHSRMLMYWDLGRAAAALISLSAAGILGLTLPVAIFAFSASMFAVYACLAILVSSALTARQTSIEVLK